MICIFCRKIEDLVCDLCDNQLLCILSQDALNRKPKKTIANLFKRVADMGRKFKGLKLGPEKTDSKGKKGSKAGSKKK